MMSSRATVLRVADSPRSYVVETDSEEERKTKHTSDHYRIYITPSIGCGGHRTDSRTRREGRDSEGSPRRAVKFSKNLPAS